MIKGFQKGHKSFLTEESKKKISIATKKRWGNHNFREKIVSKLKGGNVTSFKKGTNLWRGRKHSEESRIKMSLAKKGRDGPWKNKPRLELRNEKHWNWKGGTTDLRKRIMVCFRYRQWRSDIFHRDDFTCQKCFVRGIYLEADHNPKLFSEIIKEYNIKTVEESLNCEELWDINNGRTLCRECHNKTKYGRKKI